MAIGCCHGGFQSSRCLFPDHSSSHCLLLPQAHPLRVKPFMWQGLIRFWRTAPLLTAPEGKAAVPRRIWDCLWHKENTKVIFKDLKPYHYPWLRLEKKKNHHSSRKLPKCYELSKPRAKGDVTLPSTPPHRAGEVSFPDSARPLPEQRPLHSKGL